MKTNRHRTRRTLLSALLCAASLTTPLAASDGTKLIDQAKAAAGGLTPSDTPGFPVVISRAGSYRLSSNLTVPDANTTAIVITADDVTIDLNGFTIAGPCQLGTGIGIDAPGANVAVINGTVKCMGDLGLLVGTTRLATSIDSGARVERVRAIRNGSHGMRVGFASRVEGSTAALNGLLGGPSGVTVGIFAEAGSVIINNVTYGNDGAGIFAFQGSVIRGNTAFDNAGGNIHVFCASTVIDNATSGSLSFTPATCVMANNS